MVDGEYQVHRFTESEIEQLKMIIDAMLDICDGHMAPLVEQAAVYVYAAAAGGLRTADPVTKDRRRRYFVFEALEALAEIALKAKHLSLEQLVEWEQRKVRHVCD